MKWLRVRFYYHSHSSLSLVGGLRWEFCRYQNTQKYRGSGFRVIRNKLKVLKDGPAAIEKLPKIAIFASKAIFENFLQWRMAQFPTVFDQNGPNSWNRPKIPIKTIQKLCKMWQSIPNLFFVRSRATSLSSNVVDIDCPLKMVEKTIKSHKNPT